MLSLRESSQLKYPKYCGAFHLCVSYIHPKYCAWCVHKNKLTGCQPYVQPRWGCTINSRVISSHFLNFWLTLFSSSFLQIFLIFINVNRMILIIIIIIIIYLISVHLTDRPPWHIELSWPSLYPWQPQLSWLQQLLPWVLLPR